MALTRIVGGIMKSKFIFLSLCVALFATNCTSKGSGSAETVSDESASVTGSTSAPAATDGDVTLQMPKYFNGAAFALNTSYTTAAGNTVSLSELRYWVSNVKFIKDDNSEVAVPDAYYLLSQNAAVAGDETGERVPNFNLAAGNRDTVTLKHVPNGSYKAVKFSIGVDSTYNNNLSLRAGELHLFAHMANITWSWTTSYIFGKVWGTCSSCTGTQAFALEFGTNANYQTVTLNLPSNINVNATAKPTIVAKLDVEKLFTGIDIQSLSVDADITRRSISGFNNAAQMGTVGANFNSAVALVSTTGSAVTEPDVGKVTINVAKDFNGTPLALNTAYTDDHGNTLKFTRFRYWISNIKLTKADTTKYSVPGSYYLMSQNSQINPANINSGAAHRIAAANREQIALQDIPAANYTAIEFSIGVDPTYNNDLSIQAGELHIHQDMATYTWMWNSSYLFSQITGQCTSCAAPQNISFDIGANTNYRSLTALAFPASVSLAKGKTAVINIRANVAKVFQVNGSAGVNASTVTSAGARYINASTNSALMGNLANAYQNQVFSITSASVP